MDDKGGKMGVKKWVLGWKRWRVERLFVGGCCLRRHEH